MKIKKITVGFVVQTFDTDAQRWEEQEFIAGNQVDYEVDGDEINEQDFFDRVVNKQDEYLPFDMVQPGKPQVVVANNIGTVNM